MYILAPALALASLLPSAFAWGAAGESPTLLIPSVRVSRVHPEMSRRANSIELTTGHEIVATIAQIHLHPAVRAKLCTILPPEARCHLAPVAAWADQVRYRYPGTGAMHYINGEWSESCRRCYYSRDTRRRRSVLADR
jgi:hypothetical protein